MLAARKLFIGFYVKISRKFIIYTGIQFGSNLKVIINVHKGMSLKFKIIKIEYLKIFLRIAIVYRDL